MGKKEAKTWGRGWLPRPCAKVILVMVVGARDQVKTVSNTITQFGKKGLGWRGRGRKRGLRLRSVVPKQIKGGGEKRRKKKSSFTGRECVST